MHDITSALKEIRQLEREAYACEMAQRVLVAGLNELKRRLTFPGSHDPAHILAVVERIMDDARAEHEDAYQRKEDDAS